MTKQEISSVPSQRYNLESAIHSEDDMLGCMPNVNKTVAHWMVCPNLATFAMVLIFAELLAGYVTVTVTLYYLP